MSRKIRALIGKVGLDGHEVGAKVVANALRNAGMEVIYTGLRQTPEKIVSTAIQEDVDVIGISILSGAHMVLIGRILELLRENQATEIMVVCGGVIPRSDCEKLKGMGVREVFLSDTPTDRIVSFINNSVQDSHYK